jgi:hypothetical protein
MYVAVGLACGFLPEVRERQSFLLHAIGSRSDPVLRKDEIADVKSKIYNKAVRCHGRLQAARLLRSLSRRISTVCRAYVRCARQTRIACLVQKQLDAEDRSGRSNCTQRTGDDGGNHTALLFPASREALLLLPLCSRTLTALSARCLICIASIDAR